MRDQEDPEALPGTLPETEAFFITMPTSGVMRE
jgi:hypothetical protein